MKTQHNHRPGDIVAVVDYNIGDRVFIGLDGDSISLFEAIRSYRNGVATSELAASIMDMYMGTEAYCQHTTTTNFSK